MNQLRQAHGRPGFAPTELRSRSLRAVPARAQPLRAQPLRAQPLRAQRLRARPLRARPLARALARLAPLRRCDWVLLTAVLALSITGVLLVWSASRAALLQAGANPLTYLKKELLNLAIGLILMLAVSLLDDEKLRECPPWVYAATLLGLIAVLSPVGTSVNGASAWISLPGGFEVEPSEYAKLGLVLMTAKILGDARTADSRPPIRPPIRTVAAALACAAPVVALVTAEPALGVAVLLMVVLVSLIVLAGTRLRWLAGLGGAAAGAVLTAWWLHLLRPYQLHRLTAFINPGADSAGAGYSAAQAKIAIGSGGLLGQGLLHGQFVAGNFVPEQHTDFIFTVAGEELGFAGAVMIIVLLGVIVVRALLIAARADDQFATLVAGGIAIWFAFQSFINIGMTIGLVPVTGLPLPFVSYGGSAMFADMMAVGVLQALRLAGTDPRLALDRALAGPR
ncbi:MAG TPA: rod shape-determining protein RodA [Streptosporangiaceae bacterium]|nr:rod shape-determining protein RodA [Streptosporangiaceae bacterium]